MHARWSCSEWAWPASRCRSPNSSAQMPSYTTSSNPRFVEGAPMDPEAIHAGASSHAALQDPVQSAFIMQHAFRWACHLVHCERKSPLSTCRYRDRRHLLVCGPLTCALTASDARHDPLVCAAAVVLALFARRHCMDPGRLFPAGAVCLVCNYPVT